jgi:hypothetical protein
MLHVHGGLQATMSVVADDASKFESDKVIYSSLFFERARALVTPISDSNDDNDRLKG